jgi:hypothetical protein
MEDSPAVNTAMAPAIKMPFPIFLFTISSHFLKVRATLRLILGCKLQQSAATIYNQEPFARREILSRCCAGEECSGSIKLSKEEGKR